MKEIVSSEGWITTLVENEVITFSQGLTELFFESTTEVNLKINNFPIIPTSMIYIERPGGYTIQTIQIMNPAGKVIKYVGTNQ